MNDAELMELLADVGSVGIHCRGIRAGVACREILNAGRPPVTKN